MFRPKTVENNRKDKKKIDERSNEKANKQNIKQKPPGNLNSNAIRISFKNNLKNCNLNTVHNEKTNLEDRRPYTYRDNMIHPTRNIKGKCSDGILSSGIERDNKLFERNFGIILSKPGPGSYETNIQSLPTKKEKKRKTNLIRFHKRDFYQDITPGPGHYALQNYFDFNLMNHLKGINYFPLQKRANIFSTTPTPGPGMYTVINNLTMKDSPQYR